MNHQGESPAPKFKKKSLIALKPMKLQSLEQVRKLREAAKKRQEQETLRREA
jgi:hypothetical protein